MAVETSSAMAAVSPWPSSISFSAWARQTRRLLVLVVILKNARVEVPAVVIEAQRRVLNQPLDVRVAFLFQMDKAHHHIGNLHAGVVNVVLDLHALAAETQQPHEGVAKDGVPQVADVRGLVGIDTRMLDENLPAA